MKTHICHSKRHPIKVNVSDTLYSVDLSSSNRKTQPEVSFCSDVCCRCHYCDHFFVKSCHSYQMRHMMLMLCSATVSVGESAVWASADDPVHWLMVVRAQVACCVYTMNQITGYDWTETLITSVVPKPTTTHVQITDAGQRSLIICVIQ